mmetsp:Transcript_33708/g.59431  ORF Transcript_33708/g.59431 Transcript_33708/m.59431 type:complete len:84 (-) Transcript_33708:169-420(-)
MLSDVGGLGEEDGLSYVAEPGGNGIGSGLTVVVPEFTVKPAHANGDAAPLPANLSDGIRWSMVLAVSAIWFASPDSRENVNLP